MLKRLAIFSTLLISAILFAASSYTPHFNLELPSDGDSAWGDAIRSNFTEVDEQMYINEQAIADHEADTVGAHAATAISATGGVTLCTDSDDVQEYLDCLEGNVGPIIGGTVVTIAGDQTITGEKTFAVTPIFSDLSTGLLHSDASGSLSSSLLVDADVSSSAAITRSKIASGTNYRILANSSAGVMSENAALTSGHVIIADANGQLEGEAALANTRGGLGADASAFTGVVKASSGTFSAATLLNADIDAAAGIALTKLAATTASRALVSDGSGFVTPATTTATEIGYVNGVTSAIQTQLDGKQATGNYVTALTGDVTASGPGSVAATIANNAVSNAKLAQMATLTIKGNDTGGSADPQDLTVSEVNTMLGALSNPMDSDGDFIYGGASGVATKLDAGTLGQVIISGGAGAPTWGFPSGVTTAKTTTASFAATETGVVTLDASGGAWTGTLPDATANTGLEFIFKKKGTDNNAVSLITTSNQYINGAAGLAVTFTDTGDLVTLANHGLKLGDTVLFTSITSTTGISITTIYYVIQASTSTFKLASSLANASAGTALALTTDGTGVMTKKLTASLVYDNELLHVKSDGTGWMVIDRFTPVVSAIAQANGGGNVATGTDTLIDYETILADTHGSIVITNNGNGSFPDANRWRFNVKKNGVVHVSAVFNPNGDGSWGVAEQIYQAISKNGVSFANFSIYEMAAAVASGSYDPSTSGAIMMPVVAGDYVQVYVHQTSGNTLSTLSTTNISIQFIAN